MHGYYHCWAASVLLSIIFRLLSIFSTHCDLLQQQTIRIHPLCVGPMLPFVLFIMWMVRWLLLRSWRYQYTTTIHTWQVEKACMNNKFNKGSGSSGSVSSG